MIYYYFPETYGLTRTYLTHLFSSPAASLASDGSTGIRRSTSPIATNTLCSSLTVEQSAILLDGQDAKTKVEEAGIAKALATTDVKPVKSNSTEA